MSETIAIVKFEPSDWLLTWKIIKPVFRSGETYPFSPQIRETDAYKVWVETPTATYVTKKNNEVLGTYYIKPNQPALGSHVCNCGYIVGEQFRGKGVASLMCEHSQHEAKRIDVSRKDFLRTFTIYSYPSLTELPVAPDGGAGSRRFTL